MRIERAACCLLVLAPLLLAPAAASADTALPRYDVAAYCRKMSGLSGGRRSGLLQRNCVESEARQRAALAPRWRTLPDAVRVRCDRLSRSVGFGRYARLRSCVDASVSPPPGLRTGA